MQTIYLDISNKGVIPTIYAKQGDVGRKFRAVLTDNGLPYVPPNGSSFSVWYSGASGEGNYTGIGDKSAFFVTENTVTVEMIAQMLSNDGNGVLSIVLNDPNGNQLSTWNIPYICESVPGSGSEEAKNYYTAFANAVANLPYPDVSLSVAGKAADAKSTGDKIKSLTASDVGARPNTWLPTIAEIGAAPAGFGLGNTQRIEVGDIDNIFQNGWYCFAGNYTPQNTTYTYGFLCISSWNVNSFEQTLFPVSEHCEVLRRFKVLGHWLPWEYVNPPMQLGVEYRTTERYCGKPVYVMAYNAGSMPNAQTLRTGLPAEIEGQDIVDMVVRIKASGASMQLAYGGDPGYFIEGPNLVFSTTGNFSAYTICTIVKYTKV